MGGIPGGDGGPGKKISLFQRLSFLQEINNIPLRDFKDGPVQVNFHIQFIFAIISQDWFYLYRVTQRNKYATNYYNYFNRKDVR